MGKLTALSLGQFKVITVIFTALNGQHISPHQHYLTWAGRGNPSLLISSHLRSSCSNDISSLWTMNTWTVKLRRVPSHLFFPVSSSGFKRLCPRVVNCGSKSTRCPPCLLRRAWLCLNCLCWCESLWERNSITSPPYQSWPCQAKLKYDWYLRKRRKRQRERKSKLNVCILERGWK